MSRKSLEEQFLERLPKFLDKLEPEEKHAFQQLKDRKDIISIEDKQLVGYDLSELGKKLQKEKLSEGLVEELTSEMLRTDSWKGKKFRRYDITSQVPAIFGGKRHIVNQAVEYARKIWTELGFKEMAGNLCQTSFWNFDALYTAQDHPVRELQDTFYIKDVRGKLPDKKILEAVKQAHESGVAGSLGWRYKWQEEDAERVILRTHTTCLSAQTLASLRNLNTKDKKGKFFSVGKCFRNETLDTTHEFEFNQTEGIVVDKNANFPQLLGYLQEFFRKMGYEKIRFRPSYFPYTEPSVEIDVFHPFFNKWLELGGAGMFRPEVTIPLLGEHIPVLAWGPGFDRMIMEYYDIHDLRDMYKNDLSQLRKAKVWLR
ncbi:MAG: phenylalanine--tRNA ligase subunit alpha [Candidatus Pacearchaeota archaeon]|nr:phenylalanine--tRNA ligase subunit alpha [Candidatus Pacearchaeota archaeon]